jgi:hypothetical protein
MSRKCGGDYLASGDNRGQAAVKLVRVASSTWGSLSICEKPRRNWGLAPPKAELNSGVNVLKSLIRNWGQR